MKIFLIETCPAFDGFASTNQFYRKMRTTLLMLMVFASSMFANEAASQVAKVNLEVKNAKLTKVLDAIERQTDYLFVYDKNEVDLNYKVTVQAENISVAEVLTDIFRSTGVVYAMEGSNIMLMRGNIVQQQGKTITGKVVDANGAPIPGVTIVVKGTTTGTITDMDGNFTLAGVPEGGTLAFSFVGMKTQEIVVGSQNNITVQMAEETIGLDEVVAIGYGTIKKSDLAGSTGTVKSDVLEQRPVSSFNEALSGKIPGVNIATNSGRPGGRATVRIRGNSSISVTNDPLYVVDGVILNVASLANGTSPIDYLNPYDIQSAEVLKDASATAIYGARGANGVILITTKKGTQKGSLIQYDTSFGIGVLPRELNVLNAEEFLEIEELAYTNAQKFDPEGWVSGAYTDPETKRDDPRLFTPSGEPLYNTNWQDETIRNAFSQTHQISVSNSKEKDSYGLSLGYRDEEGLIINSWLKRYSGRFFIDTQIRDWLTIGGSLNYTNQEERQSDSMGDGGITVGRQMVEALPILPVRYDDGSFAGNNDYPGMEGGNSPVHVATDRHLVLQTQSVLGDAYANIKLMEGLEFRTLIGVNILNQKSNYYGGKKLIWISAPRGYASIDDVRNNSWQFENYLTYNKQVNDIHNLTALLGASWQHVDNATFLSSTRGFEDDYYIYNNLGVGTSPNVNSAVNAYGLNSYFTRINYSLMGKYLFTATGRVDGSSKFGSSNRYAFFPSVALAWRISEEDFLKSSSTLSNLKLRTSYGVTGNSETSPYAAQGGLGSYETVFGNSKVPATGISTLANPNLKWEKTKQANIGLDLGLFNNKVRLETDFYHKKTTDMLLRAPVPGSSGYTSIVKNIGSMKNQGFEVALNTVNISRRNFGWESTFNIAFNKNEVLSLGEGNYDIFPGPDILSASNNIIRVGEPVGSFYGYKRLGTWNQSEASEAAKYGKLPGDLKLWDKNEDGEINDADRIIIGKGIPDGYGTFSNTFRYKAFELTAEIQYMFGNDVLDISKHSAEDRTGIANSYTTVLQAWTPDNQNTMIAQIRPVGAGYTTNIDSHFVEDGSFIRGKNLLLAYNLPSDIANRLYLKNIRIYGSVQNFFLSTKYSGYDPEVSDATQTFAQGITVFGYPKPRTFSVGLNVTF